MGRLIPSQAALHHAVRVSVAALVAAELADLSGLPQGYWSVISAIVIMQGSLGGTLGAAADRVLATLAGAVVGAAAAWVQVLLGLPQLLLLAAATAPLAMLALMRPSFRLAPVTASIILMTGNAAETAMQAAWHRISEIAIGCIVGVLTAHLVLPSRARTAITASTATVLETLGALVESHLLRPGEPAIDGFSERVSGGLIRIAAAAAEEDRERAIHLSAGPPTRPLLRTLRRLRSDVAILGRLTAIADTGGADPVAVAAILRTCFAHAAACLRHQGGIPDLGPLEAAITMTQEASLLHFALITLQRDLAELCERLSELAASR